MNLRQIEAFRAVIDAGTVTRAGEMLRVSQPAVSRLIADLERGLGFALFERRRGRLTPTAEAKLFYREIEKAFVGLEHLNKAAEAIRNLQVGHLRIAAMPAFAEGLASRAIARFVAAHGGPRVELDVGPRALIVDWIAAQQFDLGLAVPPVEDPTIETRMLCRHAALCVMPAGHRLARRRRVSAKDLAGEAFVTLPLGSPFRFRIDQAFERAGDKRRLLVETRTQHSVCRMVAEGLGVSLVDPFVAGDMAHLPLAFRPFEPAVRWDILTLWPAQQPLSLAAQRLVELLAEQASAAPPAQGA